MDLLISKGAKSFNKSMAKATEHGNISNIAYMHEKGAKKIDKNLVSALSYQNYPAFKFFLSLGADINFVNKNKQFPLRISFEMKNIYSIIFLLFSGASFDGLFLLKCTKEINKISSNERSVFESLVSDYSKGSLWSVQRNKFFPLIFREILFQFLISLKIYSKHNCFKVPRPILYSIIQMWVTQQIRLNLESKKK